MKKDIDQLMQKHNVDVLWVSGAAVNNPGMYYLTGGGHITKADLFYRVGQKPILMHGTMERDEAAKTGYELLSYANYPVQDLLKQVDGDLAQATVLQFKQILSDLGITKGRVMLYGKKEISKVLPLIQGLTKAFPEIEFIGDMDDKILLEARGTKSPDEIERIRQMGVRTTSVVGKTAAFLQNHKVREDEVLIKADGTPLTIADVKSQIKLWLAEAGAEDTEGMIFAIGRDAGVPHSSGNPDDIISLGRTIVFDIFPAEAGGGYYYDFTRTWCLGYASPEVEMAHSQVAKVYDTIVAELELGVNAAHFQARTCELFEEMGHETIRQNPRLEQGYIHSLGHGLGLNVHEKPWFGRKDDPSNVLQIGSVFTIEPGLYYPEKDFGIRIEDTWYVKEDGSFEKFVAFPRDLVLPMKG